MTLPDLEWMRAWGVAPIDYDNDGWVDLVAVGETFSGEGRIALLRNEGPAGFRDVTTPKRASTKSSSTIRAA